MNIIGYIYIQEYSNIYLIVLRISYIIFMITLAVEFKTNYHSSGFP